MRSLKKRREKFSSSEEPRRKIVEEKSSPFWKEDETWYTNVKVDGEDIQVPFDDLKTSHQKDRASQKRFEEAAEYGKRVQEREAQLNAYVQHAKTCKRKRNRHRKTRNQKKSQKKILLI